MESENSAPTARDTVYLVSCVGMKRCEPLPARELYKSPWFIGVRELVEESSSPWFILSAEHGLVLPDEIIAPYDRTLNTMGRNERRAWASRVKAQMELHLPPTKRIVVFAGQRYREYLMDYLYRPRRPSRDTP